MAVILAILGVAYGAYWWWKRQVIADIDEGAQAEFERLSRQDATLMAGLDEPKFRKIYEATEMPRFPGYAVATLATFLLGTPIFLALLAWGDVMMNTTGMIPAPGEVVTRLAIDDTGSTRVMADVPPEALQYYVEDLGGFYYFFGLLLFWIAIVVFFMRRYHARTPGSLRDEIIRAR